jgi:hypothetical protein
LDSCRHVARHLHVAVVSADPDVAGLDRRFDIVMIVP